MTTRFETSLYTLKAHIELVRLVEMKRGNKG